MRVAIPHTLGRDEVRRRIKGRTHEIADFLPGGLAQVTTTWPREDRLDLNIAAMSQQITGTIDIQDRELVFTIILPPALAFVEPIVERAIAEKGRKLLT